MRYIIKGGVWKNSEDEILKAAVMKYGLNQWSRVSSLLVRKSARQCKQRWYEWLDPSIRKIEWTREEDEKLLHLTKIFPCQWRTIAPIVGRTPTQCVDRYEKLLDQAQGKQMNDPSDPRRLKPGEIDPNPESKPPRPDPIHMDEDEKEMLAEARVRLANTKGKKAKRKAREKMIEEARRLAQLQKSRELKAAGVEYYGKKKIKGINYLQEIPLERKAPDYSYQTGPEEQPKPNLNISNISLQTIEGKMRDEEEKNKRIVDAKRLKKLKERNLDQAVVKLTKDQQELFNTKPKLILPQPQLQDKDLELIGKLSEFDDMSSVQNQVTKALVGNYSQREMTPMSVRTPSHQDVIMREARNALALQMTQTPLVGGTNVPLEEISSQFASSQSGNQIPSTPNNLSRLLQSQTPAQQLQSQIPSNLQSPFIMGGQQGIISQNDGRISQSMSQVPDSWEDAQSGRISVDKLQQQRDNIYKQHITSQLKNLPAPKQQYLVDLPNFDEEEKEEEKIMDEEDLEKQRIEQKKQEMQKKIRQRSLAIQKNLPRPFQVQNFIYDHIYKASNVSEQWREAEMMIEQEINNILNFDGQNFPFYGVKPSKFNLQLESYSEEELLNASQMINKEIQQIKIDLHHGELDKDYLQSKWDEVRKNIVYSLENKSVIDLKQANKEQNIKLLQQTYENTRNICMKETKKVDQLEQKTKIYMGGYQKILFQHQKDLEELFTKQNKLDIEYEVYKQINRLELNSIKPRLDELQNFYNQLQNKNNILQQKYADLTQEMEELNNDEDELFKPKKEIMK